MQYFHANGLAMPKKMDARQFAADPSSCSRTLFDIYSGVVREVVDCCSGSTRTTLAQHTSQYRRCPEPVSKRTRSASEGYPNSTRRNSWLFCHFLSKFKAGIKYRCSKDVVLFTQRLRKIGEAPLMYRECTVSVRGVYRKGTGDLLRSYWRATKDPLNACTSEVDQRYSKSRSVVGVEAMKNKVILCLTRLLCFSRKLLSLMTSKNKAMPFMAVWLCFSRRSFPVMALRNKGVLLYGLLCFMLFNLSTAWAQSAEPRTAEGQTEIKPLQIGDTIPEELWHLPLRVVNHPDGNDTITLNDYRDKKLIILDFWATWCVPCITSLAKTNEYIHSLAEVAFLPIGYEDKAKLKPLIEKEKWRHLSAHSNIVAKEYFPYRTLPHVVWIRDGKVIAITGSLELEEENIRKVLTESEVDFQLKIEQVDFDAGKPILFDENGGGMNLLEEGSLITSAVAIMSGGVRYQDGFLLMYNRNIKQLYQEAFSSEISYPGIYARTLIDLPQELEEIVNETRRKANNRGDSVPHLYCYNLITDRDHSKADMKARMLVDLNNFFGKKYGIHASVVKRKLPVLKLVKISREPEHAEAIESLTSSGLNPLNMKGRPLSFLVKRLQHANYNLGKPIMLGSNLPSTTDLTIYGRLNDFDMVKTQLRYHGFGLVETEEEIDVLLITNKK